MAPIEVRLSPEAINVYNTFVAMLSIVAIVGAATLLAYRFWRGPSAVESLGTQTALWLAWLVATTATLGSLFYSEVLHFPPCELCWFQRIAMYPLSVVLLVGAIRKEAIAKMYALPLALVGLAISTWHYLIQIYPSLDGGACDPTNPCSSRWVEVFGFISIPFMAWAGFIVISVLLIFYVRATTHE